MLKISVPVYFVKIQKFRASARLFLQCIVLSAVSAAAYGAVGDVSAAVLPMPIPRSAGSHPDVLPTENSRTADSRPPAGRFPARRFACICYTIYIKLCNILDLPSLLICIYEF